MGSTIGPPIGSIITQIYNFETSTSTFSFLLMLFFLYYKYAKKLPNIYELN